MNRIILYPYKLGSLSSRKLAEKLRSLGKEVVRVRDSGRYRPKIGDKIINWGNSRVPSWDNGSIRSTPQSISISSNKTKALQIMKNGGVSVPEFTTDINVARTWDGKIVARTLTRSSGGKGIVMCNKDSLLPAPLYTKFIDKDAEYRVHVFNGEVIDYSKKVPMREKNDVCSHDNGYLFIRGVEHINENIELAKKAISVLGLTFGAVDIIRKDKKSYCLEVNSACGMEDTTCTAYANAIIKYANK